jgi:hypothetical protein
MSQPRIERKRTRTLWLSAVAAVAIATGAAAIESHHDDHVLLREDDIAQGVRRPLDAGPQCRPPRDARGAWSKAHEHDTHYLRVFIRQLRRKLGEDAASPRYIINEPGVGYRTADDGES